MSLEDSTSKMTCCTSVTNAMPTLEHTKKYRIWSMAKEKFLVLTDTNGVTCTGKGKEDSSIITAHCDDQGRLSGAIGWHLVFNGADNKDYALHVYGNGATTKLFDKNARKTGVLFVPEYEVMFQPSSCCPRPCCPCCPCCPQPAGSRLILKLGTPTSTSTSTQQYIAAAPGTDGGLLLKAVNDPADKDTKFVLSPLI